AEGRSSRTSCREVAPIQCSAAQVVGQPTVSRRGAGAVDSNARSALFGEAAVGSVRRSAMADRPRVATRDGGDRDAVSMLALTPRERDVLSVCWAHRTTNYERLSGLLGMSPGAVP